MASAPPPLPNGRGGPLPYLHPIGAWLHISLHMNRREYTPLVNTANFLCNSYKTSSTFYTIYIGRIPHQYIYVYD